MNAKILITIFVILSLIFCTTSCSKKQGEPGRPGVDGKDGKSAYDLAVENGFEEITLGTQRFRTETAAVMAVAMVAVKNTL